MAVKIRMTRIGRRHRPFFRINAIESRNPRDGRILEKLGHYDPLEKDKAKQIVLKTERVKYWLDNGAVPSDTVSQILLRLGIKTKYAEDKAARMVKARAQARAKGKFFNKAEKIAAEKVVEAAKAEAEAKVKAVEAAKAEAEAKVKAVETAKAEEEAKVKAAEEAAKKAEEEAKAKAEAEAKAAEEEPKAEDQTQPADEPEQKTEEAPADQTPAETAEAAEPAEEEKKEQ